MTKEELELAAEEMDAYIRKQKYNLCGVKILIDTLEKKINDTDSEKQLKTAYFIDHITNSIHEAANGILEHCNKISKEFLN